MNFKPYDRMKVKKYALESTQELLTGFNDLTPTDHDILHEIFYKLFIKYYNGRNLHLLTPEYVRAEAVDILMEHCSEIKERQNILNAVAQLTVAFDKFIKVHDTEFYR